MTQDTLTTTTAPRPGSPLLRVADGIAGRREAAMGAFRRGWGGLPQPARYVPPALLLLVLIFLPVLDTNLRESTGSGIPVIGTPNTSFSGVLFLVGVYALCAIGLNVVVGFAGLLDLGYVGFFAIGAYTVAVFGSPSSDLATAYPWLICVPIGIALTMVAGVILGGPTLRLRGDYLAIVTLGFGEIVRLTIVNSGPLGNRSGVSNIPKPPGERADGSKLFGVVDITPFYWLILAVIILVLLLVSNLERSRVGRAWLAIREDEDAAELMGVPTFRFKLWAFAIGAAVGGLSGGIFASRQGFVNPDTFDVLTSILFLAAVVIGGSGNKFGVILGAVIVVYVPERLRGFDESLFGAWFVVLVIALAVTLISRRRTLFATSLRAAATFGGGVLGLAVAIGVGTQLHSIVTDVGSENPTRLLVGSVVVVLIVGIVLIRLIGTAQAEGARVAGIFVGALLTVLVGAIAPYVFDEIGDGIQALRYFAFGIALIVMSVFRPQGLLPSRRRATELADRKKEVAVGVNA
ncbi:branched-chain amino acid ABC transporter permease [Cryptosporangium minutisporangium]|uniref:Branched-chain amino acid ABC transporter permease n=1 Tax=Cryptosporangium minutisporangium TaxID=113569 RepID=A0ABP6T0Y9_9ACTN